MNKLNRVIVTQLPALIDHFLAAMFKLGVTTLDTGEIQVSRTRPSGHGGSSTAAEADQHGRTAKHYQHGTNPNCIFFHVGLTDIAHATSDHDRLVIAPHFTIDFLLIGAEIASNVGPAKFVIEGCTTDGCFNHDIEGRRNPVWFPVRLLPGIDRIGQVQVGHAVAGQTRLRFGAQPRGAFITDLATGTGCRTRERGNGCRVVVSFYLHQDVDVFLNLAELSRFRVRVEPPGT